MTNKVLDSNDKNDPNSIVYDGVSNNEYINNNPDPQNGGGTGSSLNNLSWDDMQFNYPATSILTEDLYNQIGGGLPNLLKSNKNAWENSCAIRMSKALNYSGLKLKKAPDNGSIKGKDGYNYWFRVADLKKYIIDNFSRPTLNETGGIGIVNKFKNKKGIVVFEVSGWGNATGHFTLWDGSDLFYVGSNTPEHNDPNNTEMYYFSMNYKTDSGKVVKTKTIKLWELK